MKITLAIFSPNENAYSETFIQAHKKLPFKIKFYNSGWIPTRLGSTSLTKFNIPERIKKKLNRKLNLAEHALLKSLKAEKVDCVLAEYGPSACATLKVVSLLNLPLIVHFFGFDAGFKPTIEEYGESYKLVFAYARYVVVVSKKMWQDLLNLGCPPEKLVLTYCGPDESFFNANPHFNSPHFLSMGRFVDKKAPYLTLAAFKEVTAKFPDARLIMIGDGGLLITCKNLSRLWSIDEKVDFIGVKNPAEIFKLFENSLAFVQHSITTENGDSEGTPVAVLDAQAAQLPVISTFHAGISDVIANNETGLLVEEHDVQGMAKHMMRVLEEKGLALKLGMAGRKRVKENFSIELHLATLKKLIEDSCSGKKE